MPAVEYAKGCEHRTDYLWGRKGLWWCFAAWCMLFVCFAKLQHPHCLKKHLEPFVHGFLNSPLTEGILFYANGQPGFRTVSSIQVKHGHLQSGIGSIHFKKNRHIQGPNGHYIGSHQGVAEATVPHFLQVLFCSLPWNSSMASLTWVPRSCM